MSREIFDHWQPAGRSGKGQTMRGSNDGTNWILIAGGAAVTALSYVIGRRQKQFLEGGVEERDGNSGKAQLANHKDNAEPEYRDSEVTEASLHQESSGTRRSELLEDTSLLASVDGTSRQLHEDGHYTSNHLYRQGSLHTLKGDSNRQGAGPNKGSGGRIPSPSSTEHSEEETNFPRTNPSTQGHVQPSTQQGLQPGRTEKRDMVHRLRKQLKSRDEMILRMQAQISEHERAMSLSHSQVSELQSRLEATSKVLFDSDQEVHHLRKELGDLSANVAKMKCATESIDGGAKPTVSVGDGCNMELDMKANLEGLEKLRREVDCLQGERNAREIEIQTLSQEHKSTLEKVERLEFELEMQKMLLTEKENLLDLNEQELSKVTGSLQDSQRKLEAQATELETLRHRKAKLEAYVHALNAGRGGSGNLNLRSQEIISATSMEVLDTSGHLPGSGRPLDTKNFSRSLYHAKSAETNPKSESEDIEDPKIPNPSNKIEKVTIEEDSVGMAISDIMVAALQQEVEQLSTALATQSKEVFEQKQETTQLTTKLVEDLQHIDSIMDTALDSAPETLKREDSKWVLPSHQLSFSTGATSPAQVNELVTKLEEVAKQKRVEEEIAELSKHQAKIAELQQRIARLTRDSVDEVCNEQTLRAAALILGLVDKLAAQEEQARQTASEVQRLSTSFQLLTPIVAKFKKEELQTLLEEGTNSGQTHSNGNGHVKYSIPSTQPRYAAQDRKANKIGTPLFEAQATFSSPHITRPSANHQHSQYSAPRKLDEHCYEFHVSASGPPASKIRRLSSKWEGKSSQRKKPLFDTYSSGSIADTFESVDRVTSPDSEKTPHLQEHVDNTDGSQDEGSSSGSATASLSRPGARSDSSPESNSRSHDMDSNVLLAAIGEKSSGHSSWAVEEEKTHSPSEVEQLMAASSPGQETILLPTFEEYSPPLQVRSPHEGTGSSRRYLFNSDASQIDHAIDLEASTGYSATGMESALEEEETTSGSSFLIARPESASLSPFSKMMARLDLKEALPASTSLQGAPHEIVMMSDFPKDVIGGEIAVPEDAEKLRLLGSSERDDMDESGSESGSIDSDFNEILDGTLNDLLKVCSTLVTPADTPTSSVFSQGSDARTSHYF